MTLRAVEQGEMPLSIEDYGLIGDCRTAALVGCNGSIDWLCWPNFDSDACLSALLGTPDHGRWLIAPNSGGAQASRCYRGDTLILETSFETDTGTVALIDFMPTGGDGSVLIRRVEGIRGTVNMNMQLTLRFEYGLSTPWLTLRSDGLDAVAGANRVRLRTHLKLHRQGRATSANFNVGKGEVVDFVLCWSPAHLPVPDLPEADEALTRTEAFWQEWAGKCQLKGRWRAPILRSLLTLKALSFSPTGAIIAAPTTSLPEQLGGSRNWDYRYCWLRDATLTLIALVAGGYNDEAKSWGDWLHRAVAGNPEEMQIMYGIFGERRLTEWSPSWLPGYKGAAPVRVGNAASGQMQLDIFGEVMGALRIARHLRISPAADTWPMQVRFVNYLEQVWEQPDDGIWEIRGDRRQFTYSKVMAWFAVNSAVRDAEDFELDAPLARWRSLRDRIHAVVCEKGFDSERNSFTQSFGNPSLDASLLQISSLGFLPANDPRIIGTIKAIEEDLLVDGFVLRYQTEDGGDGLPFGEGAFLPCSFWLVSAYESQGRHEEAVALFERLLSLCNDVGLLSEECDPKSKRQLGNFPQAYSHLSLILAALTLNGADILKLREAV